MTVRRVYIVAGELSGDNLGTGLMRALKARHPDVEFRGIGGPGMIGEGMESRFPLETLSVMGLVEVIKHLPELIRVRRHLRADALAWQPDIMIGIDAPDFNLGLERQLRQAGITTAHYVSPTVWAWRQGRIKGIARSVDAMLTFLPFEAAFYASHRIPVAFVGHPLADELPLTNDRAMARAALGLDSGTAVLALLPGSRANEIRFLGDTFLDAAEQLCRTRPGLQVVIPAATPKRHEELKALLAARPGSPAGHCCSKAVLGRPWWRLTPSCWYRVPRRWRQCSATAPCWWPTGWHRPPTGWPVDWSRPNGSLSPI
ncbi:lipid-A-disaccharide synthase [Halomonas sp. BC04]|nr:lipid-A-disaccharide synthase [Halomonas sp. BC04]